MSDPHDIIHDIVDVSQTQPARLAAAVEHSDSRLATVDAYFINKPNIIQSPVEVDNVDRSEHLDLRVQSDHFIYSRKLPQRVRTDLSWLPDRARRGQNGLLCRSEAALLHEGARCFECGCEASIDSVSEKRYWYHLPIFARNFHTLRSQSKAEDEPQEQQQQSKKRAQVTFFGNFCTYECQRAYRFRSMGPDEEGTCNALATLMRQAHEQPERLAHLSEFVEYKPAKVSVVESMVAGLLDPDGLQKEFAARLKFRRAWRRRRSESEKSRRCAECLHDFEWAAFPHVVEFAESSHSSALELQAPGPASHSKSNREPIPRECLRDLQRVKRELEADPDYPFSPWTVPFAAFRCLPGGKVFCDPACWKAHVRASKEQAPRCKVLAAGVALCKQLGLNRLFAYPGREALGAFCYGGMGISAYRETVYRLLIVKIEREPHTFARSVVTNATGEKSVKRLFAPDVAKQLWRLRDDIEAVESFCISEFMSRAPFNVIRDLLEAPRGWSGRGWRGDEDLRSVVKNTSAAACKLKHLFESLKQHRLFDERRRRRRTAGEEERSAGLGLDAEDAVTVTGVTVSGAERGRRGDVHMSFSDEASDQGPAQTAASDGGASYGGAVEKNGDEIMLGGDDLQNAFVKASLSDGNILKVSDTYSNKVNNGILLSMLSPLGGKR